MMKYFLLRFWALSHKYLNFTTEPVRGLCGEINLKTAVGSGKVMQDFDSELIPAEGHIPQVGVHGHFVGR